MDAIIPTGEVVATAVDYDVAVGTQRVIGRVNGKRASVDNDSAQPLDPLG